MSTEKDRCASMATLGSKEMISDPRSEMGIAFRTRREDVGTK